MKTYVTPALSTALPQMDGTATSGSATLSSRQDHVHPSDTSRAPLASPTFTGTPAAPTATAGTSTTQLATTAFVQAAITGAGAITDAPSDGVYYARRNSAWVNDAVNPAVQANVGRNLIHNALFNVQQRGVGAFTNGYTADRWYIYKGPGDTASVSLYSLADADRSQLGDEAGQWTPGITFTGTSGSSDQVTFFQNVENVRRTAGKTLTLSFWARAPSSTPKIGVAWAQNMGTGGSPSGTVAGNFGVTASLTSSFVRYTMTATLPSLAGKTLGSNSNDNLGIQFFLSCAPSNANAASAGNIGAQSGQVNLWGVQLEVGSVATPLEKVDPGEDLRRCQRFAYAIEADGWAVTSYASGGGQKYYQSFALPVSMRAAPTLSSPNWGSLVNTSSQAVENVNPSRVRISCTATGAGQIQAILASGILSADL